MDDTVVIVQFLDSKYTEEKKKRKLLVRQTFEIDVDKSLTLFLYSSMTSVLCVELALADLLCDPLSRDLLRPLYLFFVALRASSLTKYMSS